MVTDTRGGRRGLRHAGRRPDRGQGPGPRRAAAARGWRSGPTTTAPRRSRSPAAGSRGPRGWPRACSSSSRPRTAVKAAASLLGKTLVTYQTGAQGQPISKVLVTVGHDIARELYLGLAIDRGLQCPVLMASTEGGVEIETVAHETPEKIHREPIDVGLGLADFQARKVCKALGLSGDTAKKGRRLPQELRQALPRHGCLARRDQPADRHRRRATSWRSTASSISTTTPLFRHPDIAAMLDETEEDPAELRAGKSGLSLRQPRRRHRLPGQRRGPGDEHDGPDQVPRRRARQLPRRRRRRQQGPGARRVPHPALRTHASRPCWSTSSAAS